MQARVRETPEAAASGEDPAAARRLARTPAFRAWASLTHASQSLMWRAVEPCADRAAREVEQDWPLAGSVRGSLSLDPTLRVPPPIGETEIHRQPGGYVADGGPRDLRAGLRYLGSSLIYASGKGSAGAGTDARGQYLVDQVRARWADLAPRRILDLGCGIGLATQAVALAWPQAECHAVDCAPGLLRFAHVAAELRGVPVHFRQRDAAATDFPDAHFDLIVSNILFHETNADHVPAILRECRRLLAPGGAMLHVDVPTQRARIGFADRVMNDWQVDWNGEPFWRGFAERDLRADIVAAGFDPARAFAEHAPRPGGGVWYVFGARA